MPELKNNFYYEKLSRLRKTSALRNLSSETRLHLDDFVMPYFVVSGKNRKEPIPSMPGIYRYSADLLLEEIKKIKDDGLKSVLLFGVLDEHLENIRKPRLLRYIEKKFNVDREFHGQFTTGIFDDDGVVQNAIRQIRHKFNSDEVSIMADICICAYTNHGHCGLIDGKNPENYRLNNDATLGLLSAMAVSCARAGADIVAPSAMADGQVGAIRNSLDNFGFKDVAIMGYSAKYASSFYGPFRDAAKSPPRFGSRKSYQMDPRNVDEAIREVITDIKEGADIVMVKPALSYLDVIRAVKKSLSDYKVPLAAYNVSGEYSMVKFGAANGIFDEKKAALEILYSIKRAGADIIITYWAKDIAAKKWLNEEIF